MGPPCDGLPARLAEALAEPANRPGCWNNISRNLKGVKAKLLYPLNKFS